MEGVMEGIVEGVMDDHLSILWARLRANGLTGEAQRNTEQR